MRRSLRALSSVLIAAGVLLLLDAGLTLAWQEPVSALYARFTQDQLGGDLRALERSGPTSEELRGLRVLESRERRQRFLARSLKRRTDEGDAAGRISIPKIDADFVVVDGTTGPALRKGPGFFGQTPFPGAPGTVAVAGHRTTYMAPFRRIDELRSGDRVVVDMPYGRFTYLVERSRIVSPSAIEVIRDVGYERLVLSACHPLYSAEKRIVVFARLLSAEEPDALSRAGTRRPSSA